MFIYLEILYYIRIKYGIDLLNKTRLLNIIGQKAEKGYIRRYYRKKRLFRYRTSS
jgi:hypothetical protein